ncbi:uncharacterized protein [Garra rufa]|uniref:uncharacterized protein n=1 Tax=Garra rufa TaxID=137080 RepID=UPI003CCEF7BE
MLPSYSASGHVFQVGDFASPEGISEDALPYGRPFLCDSSGPVTNVAPTELAESPHSVPCLVPGPCLHQGKTPLSQSCGPLDNLSSVPVRRELGMTSKRKNLIQAHAYCLTGTSCPSSADNMSVIAYINLRSQHPHMPSVSTFPPCLPCFPKSSKALRPISMAGQRAQEAMVDQGAREAIADQTVREAEADQRAQEAMVDQGAREAIADQTVREAEADQRAQEAMYHSCIYFPGVKVFGQDTTVMYGENATMLCQLTGTDDYLIRIIWKKKTRENPEEKFFFVIHQDGKIEVSNELRDRVQFIGNIAKKNGSIQILRMSLLDEGIYTCIFNFISTGPFETNINATVFVCPESNVTMETPVAGSLDTTLASCFASNARPAAEVTWRLGDLEKTLNTETNQTVHPNGTVTVVSYLLGAPYKHLNKKTVQCVVKHNTLKDELVLDYTIHIHYPPESVFIIPDSVANTKEYQCVVDSNPEPTNYTWTRVNKSTPYYEGNRLPVPNLSPDFNGLYICYAKNKYGSSSGFLHVDVHTGIQQNTLPEEGVRVSSDKWVKNLSDRELTGPEMEVLAKGLNFAVTPDHIPVVDMITATESAIRNNNISEEEAEEAESTFLAK